MVFLLLSFLGVLCYNLPPLHLSCFSRAAEGRRGKSRGGASNLCICAMPSSFSPAYEHKALCTEAGCAFLYYYVYLVSLGILAPGVITCWQFYSSWFLLGAGGFSGLMVGQGQGKLAWIAVRGLPVVGRVRFPWG